MARLAEAADDHLVARLEEEDLRLDYRVPRARRLPAANASGALPVRASSTRASRSKRPEFVRNQLGHAPTQLDRQVVDHAVANVLEQLADRRLAGTGQARNDHDVRRARPFGAGLWPAVAPAKASTSSSFRSSAASSSSAISSSGWSGAASER
jgi:hypothetical protein